MEALEEMKSPTSEAEWEELLAQCNSEAKVDTESGSTPLIDMLGGYKPMSILLGRETETRFYVKKPKLRQRLLMAEDTQTFTGESAKDIIVHLCKLVTHCVYRRKGAEFVEASVDDLLDELNDEEEAKTLCVELLGMQFGEKGGTQETPITETSSDASQSDLAGPRKRSGK